MRRRISPFRALSTVALAVALGACGSGGSSGGDGGGGTVQPLSYRILATNDLGMHCVDADFSVFSILPPYNVVGAQVIRTDTAGRPSLAGDAAVALRYSPIPDANGSINSRSVGKTNFWQHAAQLFGANLAPGQGLKGLYMPADATSPEQTSLTWNTAGGLFKAEGIPIIPTDDAGNSNRYPLMRIEATEKSSGEKVATLDIVLPVSEETTCSNCHATGSVAARGSGVSWSANADLEVQSRENVLLLHDARRGTGLMAARPVLCAACHYSAALDLAGSGPNGTQSSHGSMSAVMHAYHADKMQDATGAALPDSWVAQGQIPPSPESQACYQCHPGKNTQCLRGAMTNAVTCQNCHGGMSAVGAAANLQAGGSIDGKNDGKARRPWIDLPRCQSCHTGDAASHQSVADASLMATDGLRMLLAFRSDDPAASPIKATNKRFAENDNRLYRFSKGHGGVGCEGCHNSTHAIWPNPVEAHNDNVAAEQLQGHSGTVTECSTCHATGTLPLSLGGPHGMHPVNDSRWTNGGHGDLAEGSQQSCAACHGTDFRGTVLSRTAAERTWRTESGIRTIGKGLEIGCYDCHSGPGGGD
ncbi:MAG: hypothetical protein JNK40_05650 [Chromatiales bacterium]|nr:hypothetical protein [Chromatiales bacterium]